jgi:hypothetical protein
MKMSSRPRLASSLAVIGVSTLVVTPAMSYETPTPIERTPVELAAFSQPLPAAPAVAGASPLSLIGQQVTFNVGFVANFLGTGAALFARELPIPVTLLTDIGTGTPLPAAIGTALQDFAAVELDAGRDLVAFAAQYVGFQAQFVAGLIPGQSAVGADTSVAPASLATRAPVTLALTHRSDGASPPPAPVSLASSRGTGGEASSGTTEVGSRRSHGTHDGVDRQGSNGSGSSSTSASSGPGKGTNKHDERHRHDPSGDGSGEHHGKRG